MLFRNTILQAAWRMDLGGETAVEKASQEDASTDEGRCEKVLVWQQEWGKTIHELESTGLGDQLDQDSQREGVMRKTLRS